MAIKRTFVPVPVAVSDSGNLLPDLPPYRLNPSDYTKKLNWSRFQGTERKREGWDYPQPLDDWTSFLLGTFDETSPCEALKGIRRPNNTYAIVGCGGGKIKAFSYDANAWVTIGSGYSVDGQLGFTWWQIEDVAGYAVFNNGRDLMCWWQVGDVSVTPIYEFRESGYASCGHIVEYYGVLMCANILEIDPSMMEMLMNGPNPYETIDEDTGLLVARIGFERVWSNFADVRDFAATVNGSMTQGTNVVTIDWPMISFHIGDVIVVEGAGAAGGNLQTVITGISGTTIDTADNAQTTVTEQAVLKATAVSSIVGSDQLEGDGSTILIQMALKNQLLSYKASGEIFQSYYTGTVTQPFASQRVSTSKRAIRFPRALVNVLDQYHMFPGENHFYQYLLSAQQPVQHPMMLGAEVAQFFSRVVGAGTYAVFGAENNATGEMFFAYPMGMDEEEDGYAEYSARGVLALNFNEGQESIDEIDGFNFMCAATVQKPLTGFTCDQGEVWFLMGDMNGRITLYGRSNLALFTMLRYGEAVQSTLVGGFFSLPGFTGFNYSSADVLEKFLRRITPLLSDWMSTGQISLSLYGARSTNDTMKLLGTYTMTDPAFPATKNLYYRKMYFQMRIDTSIAEPIRYAGMDWLVSGSDTNQITQLKG